MFCENCGSESNSRFCKQCGKENNLPKADGQKVIEFKETRSVHTVIPGAPTSGLAIAGLITAFLIPLVGIILGFVARSEIKNSQGKKAGENLANLAIILGFTFSFIYFIVWMYFFSLAFDV
jgi:uncharacterized membrane protein YvbJ